MADPGSLSVEYVEQLLERYLEDPGSVSPRWRRYFAGIEEGAGAGNGGRFGPTFRARSIFNPAGGVRGDGRTALPAESTPLADRCERLVQAYRLRGHLAAKIDPLGRPRPNHPELAPQYHGFDEADLDRPVSGVCKGRMPGRTVRELLDHLRATYCGSVGVEFMHIDDVELRRWLELRMESSGNRRELTADERVRLLHRLTEAALFEKFVLTKYIGAKTFSLEGAEILIPLLDLTIEKASSLGAVQIVMGMAHRGRLNVLANILGKSAARIFSEFEESAPPLSEGGDVKYHLGHSNDWGTASGRKVHLTLCFNPSHLEFVNPVATGSVRAKQDRAGDIEHLHAMTVLVHGDAAFAGEGIVQETLNLTQLPGYSTGGIFHVVVNNQIGFTTMPAEGRSGTYATDVAKMLQVPIFHVNGEDPEAVAHVVDLALDFRDEFHRDVIVDLYCYRKRGHNESDEPEFTQPILYHTIKRRRSLQEIYQERLVERGDVTQEEADRVTQEYQTRLEEAYEKAQAGDVEGPSFELGDVWRGYRAGREPADEDVQTGAEAELLRHVLVRLTEVPDDFHVHPKLKRWLKRRRAMAEGERPLDWSAAEALALATVAMDGYRVRLSGQDSVRGTFSHRHAILHDVKDGHTYMPLRRVASDLAPIEIINSPLCEAGALGFEYGYSMEYPDCLVAWEAQFGDFCNAAQVIVDQFVTSAEEKWRRLSGITLLLPHGFEGQGPEHSSARLERFLRLATKDNIQVVVPSTPAQYFHCLRRQVLRRWLKPLVVLTPKSLLRHPRVVSDLEECATGGFFRVLPDQADGDPDSVRKILLCSGKIYYEMLQQREQSKQTDVAILRLEQLYPFPDEQLRRALEPYREGTPAVWVQEEPHNMGACQFVSNRFHDRLFDRHPLGVITRKPAASPATGMASVHKREQQELIARAFDED